MTIGTRSLLYGAHQFLLHPLYVAAAWWRLYGPPLDPRLWIAFFVHDLGYFGKPDLDGPAGKSHPELGARIMRKLFGTKWGELCLYHSRSRAQQDGRQPSLLSHADKLATQLVPRWLFLSQVKATGEITEYLHHFRQHLQSKTQYAAAYGIDVEQPPPSGILYGSLEHWYWAITQLYTKQWLDNKQQELFPELEQFKLSKRNYHL